jgi:HK97 family phage portal protein
MGLFDFFKINNKGESRSQLSLNNPNVSLGDFLAESIHNNDLSVNELTVLSIPSVRRAVNVLASTIAGLPIDIKQKRERYFEKIEGHGLEYYLNYEPNQTIDKVTFFQAFMTNVLLHGNGFALIRRDQSYNVESIELIHPDRVTVKVLKNNSIRYEVENASRKSYRADEVLHVMGSTSNGFIGYSTLETNRRLFEIALNTQMFAKTYFENGGFMSGIVKHPASLSDSAYKRLKSSLSRYSGSEKAGKQLILDEGMTYEQLTSTPQDAGLTDVNLWLTGEFSRLFGVPPFLLQDLSKSTLQNVESLTLAFVRHTIQEHLHKLESELSRKLLSEADKMAGICVKFDLDQLLKSDTKTRGEYLKNLFHIGAISVDEVRLAEGMKPLNTEGSTKHFIQQQYISIEDTINPNEEGTNKNTNIEDNEE